MIRANFNTYQSYVTDSLYQWDKNQDLVISGLNLSVAPEIHFANADMERALVRQSTLNDGIITVRIPNSLLQTSYPIKAYVGVYEGDSFKVIESVIIPIMPKEKPADYTIEDSDEEIYSFNALEYKINNSLVGERGPQGERGPAGSGILNVAMITRTTWPTANDYVINFDFTGFEDGTHFFVLIPTSDIVFNGLTTVGHSLHYYNGTDWVDIEGLVGAKYGVGQGILVELTLNSEVVEYARVLNPPSVN